MQINKYGNEDTVARFLGGTDFTQDDYLWEPAAFVSRAENGEYDAVFDYDAIQKKLKQQAKGEIQGEVISARTYQTLTDDGLTPTKDMHYLWRKFIDEENWKRLREAGDNTHYANLIGWLYVNNKRGCA